MSDKKREVVICKLPRGQETWAPDLFPGSDDAAEMALNHKRCAGRNTANDAERPS